MRRLRLIVLILLGALALQATGADLAGAVEPREIGQTAASSPEGGCQCLAVQLADSGTRSYVIPFSGVLTYSSFYVGSYTAGLDEWVRAETVRNLGGGQVKVNGEGVKHVVTGIATADAHSYPERIPATAGDVLGAEFNTSPTLNATPRFFAAGAADQAGFANGFPGIGETVTATPVGPTRRVNIEATLEADADGDGYGDTSQDLCPGSPVATGACSGVLFGSTLRDTEEGVFACGYPCLRVQKTVGGHSTAAPFDGVVVRWRLLKPPAGEFGIRVVQPNGPDTYRSLGSDMRTVPPPHYSQIVSYDTRLPIPAGAYVGLVSPAFGATLAFKSEAGSSYGVSNDDAADGATIVETAPSIPGTVQYDADIEPDADHDGYGDITQDGCPTDPTTHNACPAAAASSSPSPGPASTPAAAVARHKPSISGLHFTPRRIPFEAGAKLHLRLSDAAKVAFATEAKVVCAAAKGCKPWHRVSSFTRSLLAGADTVGYPGSYRKRGARRWLKPGSYRITAVPTSAAGKGAAARASFTVLAGAGS